MVRQSNQIYVMQCYRDKFQTVFADLREAECFMDELDACKVKGLGLAQIITLNDRELWIIGPDFHSKGIRSYLGKCMRGWIKSRLLFV